MRQVFDGWGVASKRKVSVHARSSYDILSAPVATDEYISYVEGLLFICHHSFPRYTIGGVFFMQLCTKNAFRFKEQLGCIHSVQGICLGGLFVSLYVVLSLFNIRFSEILEFRLAFLALAAAAFYGGPLMGMTVGIAGDVISFFVTPQSAPFFPGFTLTYAVMGFLFGIFLYRAKITPGRALIGGLTEFTISCTLSTLWLHLMYGMPWQYLLTIRLVKNTIALGVYTVLLYVFLNAFSRILGAAGTASKPVRS